MINADASKDLKSKIEANQIQLKQAIRKHNKLIIKLREADARFIKQVRELVDESQQQLIIIGLEQKSFVDKLRKEYRVFQKNFKASVIKNGIEERRLNLANSIARARKQNIAAQQPVSLPEETEIIAPPLSPEPVYNNPLNPQDISQTEFLTYFGLATHEVFKEIQTKRAERKRRRTANPQFLYSKGWDISKRKRNVYLSNVSPPHTRSSKKRTSPPLKTSRASSPETKKQFTQNWPSGLSIERIKSSAEEEVCTECHKPENLIECDLCTSTFHVACHNRPLIETPKHCPKCLKIVLAHEAEVNEKLVQRSQLVEKNKLLSVELNNLQDKHSELEVSLKTQHEHKQQVIAVQETVETKIRKLLTFVTSMQDFVIPTAVASPKSPVLTIVEDNPSPTADSLESR